MSNKQLLAVSVIFENLGRDETADPNIRTLLKPFKEAECLYGKPDIAMCVAAPSEDIPKISEALNGVCTVERFEHEGFAFYTPPNVNLQKFSL